MFRMLLASVLLSACVEATASSRAPLHLTFDLSVPQPPAAVDIGGRRHLVHELHLVNVATAPIAVTGIAVADADADAVLARYEGGALDALLGGTRILAADAPEATLAPGEHAIAYFWIALDDDDAPRALAHRVAYALSGGDSGTVAAPPVAVSQQAPAVLSPPLRGGPWVGLYAPEMTRGHRRVVYAVDGVARIPGRYAIDWVKLDAQGGQHAGDGAALENFHGYGADVLAVADAVVAAAHDDIDEDATCLVRRCPRHPLQDASGNYVALDLGDGRFVFYEHLKPGSLRVKAGDRVRRGEVIAAVGLTGDATGPHLHMHVADANAPLAAEGSPWVLDRYELLGGYGSIEAFGRGAWTPRADGVEAVRRHELPAANVVVRFPD